MSFDGGTVQNNVTMLEPPGWTSLKNEVLETTWSTKKRYGCEELVGRRFCVFGRARTKITITDYTESRSQVPVVKPSAVGSIRASSGKRI
jgi:hypothetical protein